MEGLVFIITKSAASTSEEVDLVTLHVVSLREPRGARRTTFEVGGEGEATVLSRVRKGA